jgi:hypothetical protein
MKKILIGTLVGTILYFTFQSAMWVGGFHDDFTSYTPNQDSIMQCLQKNISEDGLYSMPNTDPNSPNALKDNKMVMKESIGKPWAMVFYHQKMMEMSTVYILKGVFYSLVACLLVSIVLYSGSFTTFGGRFIVSMSFALFAISQGVMDDMNWWSFPWSFIKPQLIDLFFGWGLCSVWLAWYVKK